MEKQILLNLLNIELMIKENRLKRLETTDGIPPNIYEISLIFSLKTDILCIKEKQKYLQSTIHKALGGNDER